MDRDQLLAKKGLTYDELEPEERETLNSWLASANRQNVDLTDIREYIQKMKHSVEDALTQLDESPRDWLSLLCFLIPLIGIVRKWYIDQKRVELTARLRNYMLLEALLMTPLKAKEYIERQIAQMASGKSR